MTIRRHGRETTVYVDGYDLSGSSNQFDVQDQADAVEVSGFQNRKQYVMGQMQASITHNGWFDTLDNTGAHAILKARNGEVVNVAASYGVAVDDVTVMGSAALMTQYSETSPVGGAVATSCAYIADQKFEFGRILWPKSDITGDGNAVDGLAGTNGGIFGMLHVFEILGGTPVIEVQHSTTGTSAWSSLLTFTATNAVTSEVKEASGTVRRYLRATVSGGSANAWIGISRR